MLKTLKTFLNPEVKEFKLDILDYLQQEQPLKTDPDWNKKIDFIHEESKLFCENTIATHEYLQKKITYILTFLFSVSSLIVTGIISIFSRGFYGTHYSTTIFTFLVITLIGYILKAIFLAWYGVDPKPLHMTGSAPDNLTGFQYVKQPLSNMKIAEIIHYQEKINFNNTGCTVSAQIIRFSLIGIIAVPIIAFFASLIIHYI